MNVEAYPIKINDYVRYERRRAERVGYDAGYKDGYNVGLLDAHGEERKKVVDEALEILDEVSSKSSMGGEYWNSAKTITVLRRRFMTLKAGE